MVQIPTPIKDTIQRYVRALRTHNIPVQQVVLFGSYAKGTYDQWSDIDLAVVSDIFEGSRMLDRDKIRAITLSVSSLLEVLPYKPDDFTADDPFVKEILETGIQIA